MKDLLIIGSGGVGRDVLNIIDRSYKNNFSKIYFLDDNFSLGKLINGIEVVGKTKDLNKKLEKFEFYSALFLLLKIRLVWLLPLIKTLQI